MAARAILEGLDDVLADFDLSFNSLTVSVEPTPASHLAIVTTLPVPATPSTRLPAPLASARDEFYASLAEADAAKLQATATRINRCRRIARESTLEIGKELIAIKATIPGHFDRWLKHEFDMSKATGWNYINVAQEFGHAPEVIDVLPSATAYRLAAKATPESVRKAIVLEIKAGATPTKADVERRIAEARSSAADEKRARKQAERERADAERQRRDDDQAWQVRVAELTEAGKTEDEIGRERQVWDTTKQMEERQDQIQLEAGERHDEEQGLVSEKYRAERDQQCEKACEAVDLLRNTLGKDFEAFRSLMADADVHEFKEAVLSGAAGQQNAD